MTRAEIHPHRLALRPKEAAEALGVSERTLRQMLPELPHIRRGGSILIPLGCMRQALQSGTPWRLRNAR